jgi:hypothetical protein
MTLSDAIRLRLRLLAERVMSSRPPDQVIGGREDPYMLRWWLTPWRKYNSMFEIELSPWARFVNFLRLPNVYVHQFYRSDDDRALHDHPWANCSIVLTGEYTEHTIDAGGIRRRAIRKAGDIVVRRARAAHRIELHAGPCQTLFITGFRTRSWGFHCPEQGWIPWRRFTNAADGGSTVGPGCDG